MDQITVQYLEDLRRRKYLASNEHLQQETLATFILSCSILAYDLNKLCQDRTLGPFPGTELENSAAYITAAIKKQFRKQFGYELFDKEVKNELV